MNHRELVLSSRKKPRFHFLQLPEQLQDEIIDGLDRQTMTLEAARDYLADRGYTLSHEAIAAYYRAVRRERRLFDATQELTRIFESFADQPLEENLRCFTNFLIAEAAKRVSEGDASLKIDLAKVIATSIDAMRQSSIRLAQSGEQPQQEGGPQGISPDTLRVIREQVYGL